jgi:Ca2+-binding RTX toxin-like protein
MGGVITSDLIGQLTYTTDGETFEIDKYVLVTAGNPAVISQQNQSTLINRGFIFGLNSDTAVAFLGDDAVITNTSDGVIRGGPDGAHGIVFDQGSQLSLNNQGTIVGFAGLSLGELAIINNQAGGMIEGTGGNAIQTFSDARVSLTNRGTIAGGIDLNGDTGNVNDAVTNKGEITGDVFLGVGNDKFKAKGGGTSGDVFGEDGNDTLIGGKKGDTLDGGADSDLLRGGKGKDKLFGGTDSDTFDFNSIKDSVRGSKRDKIIDFQRGPDEIDLKNIDAKTGVSGNQKFKWIGKSDFHDKKGEVRYEDKGSKVIVQGDVNGDSKADFEIFVKVGNLSDDDFVL